MATTGDPAASTKLPTLFAVVELSNTWEELLSACRDMLTADDAELLFARLGKVAKSAIVEFDYIDKDYRNVYSAFYSKKFMQAPSRAVRLHFFDCVVDASVLEPSQATPIAARVGEFVPPTSKQAMVLRDSTLGYLGSVVLRPTEYSKIGRTLLDARKLDLPTGARLGMCLATFAVHIMGDSMTVKAFPHQSQDAEVHSCAHTAIWSLCRYLSQRYPFYPERYPHDIASLNNDLRWGRVIPGRGLYVDQVAAMLGRFGLSAEIYVVEHIRDLFGGESDGAGWPKDVIGDARKDHLLRLLSCYIESGMPAVVHLDLNPGAHSVVAMGIRYGNHPLVKRKDGGHVIPSSDFVDAVVVNDDNFAPYQFVERNLTGAALEYGVDSFDSLVVPLPEKVFLTAEQVELIATGVANEVLFAPEGKWPGEHFVRHVVCTSSRNYKQFRQRQSDSVGQACLRLPLPHFLWLVEFYRTQDWPNRMACLEMAIDATAGKYDDKPYCWLRVGNDLHVNYPRILNRPPDVAGISFQGPETELTFPGFCSNLETIP